MKKYIMAIMCTLPLLAQAEVCLNYGCVILGHKKDYDKQILPYWEKLKQSTEKSKQLDKETEFIINHYDMWRDVGMEECRSQRVDKTQGFAITERTSGLYGSCVHDLIEKRVHFLKVRNYLYTR